MADELDDVRKVRMTKKLMDEFASRDKDCNELVWDWGEPDEEGFYSPTVTIIYKKRKKRPSVMEVSPW